MLSTCGWYWGRVTPFDSFVLLVWHNCSVVLVYWHLLPQTVLCGVRDCFPQEKIPWLRAISSCSMTFGEWKWGMSLFSGCVSACLSGMLASVSMPLRSCTLDTCGSWAQLLEKGSNLAEGCLCVYTLQSLLIPQACRLTLLFLFSAQDLSVSQHSAKQLSHAFPLCCRKSAMFLKKQIIVFYCEGKSRKFVFPKHWIGSVCIPVSYLKALRLP